MYRNINGAYISRSAGDGLRLSAGNSAAAIETQERHGLNIGRRDGWGYLDGIWTFGCGMLFDMCMDGRVPAAGPDRDD